MSQKTPITVAHGDGIGPEIMEASLHIIQEAGAALEIETIDVGEKVEPVGVVLYPGSKGQGPQAFGDALTELGTAGLELKMIDCRGTIVYRGGMTETFVADNYRARFEAGGNPVTHEQIAALYRNVTGAGYDIVKTESLRLFDGKQGFTLAQGQ
jgi:hypothetical protein